MNEATIYKTFAAVLAILAACALVAVFTGHAYHIATLATSGILAVILKGEAKKEEQ